MGKITASQLRAAGWRVHTIADHFPNDATDVDDEVWITTMVEQGWVGITKDKHVRYRAAELGALTLGHIFCLSDGNLRLNEATDRLLEAGPAIERAIDRADLGFWFVYGGGRIVRKWPPT